MKVRILAYISIALATFTFGVLIVSAVASLIEHRAEAIVVDAEISSNEIPQTASQSVDPEPVPVIDTFDPTGRYYIDDSHGITAAFRDIKYVEIETSEYNEDDQYAPIVPRGRLLTGKSYDTDKLRSYKMAKLFAAGRQITFQTETREGVYYTFVGHFIDFQSEGEETGPDLKGKLVKMKNGKPAAEMNAKFWVEGC